MERWLSGRKRLPAKQVSWETGIEGSNPSLSASLRCDAASPFACYGYGGQDGWQAMPAFNKTCKLKSFEIFSGEMAEWLNAAVLKTAIPGDRDRGFESLSLRHPTPYVASDGRPIIFFSFFTQFLSS